MTAGTSTRWKRIGAGVLAGSGVAIVAASLAGVGTAAPSAKAIVITKKTDQSSPELFNNFSDTAGLGANGRLAQVSGTIDCTGGLGEQHLARIRVEVSQSGVVAEGYAFGRCTGNLEPWSAVVITRASKRFERGSAAAHAWVGVPLFGSGMQEAAYDWSHSLTLLP